MGNKIQKIDYSEKILNEMIPMELRKNSQRNKLNSTLNYYKRSRAIVPSRLKNRLESNSVLDFSDALSRIIIKNKNEKNFNANIYLTTLISNDQTNFEGEIEPLSEISNDIQINYLDDIITMNNFKKIYDADFLSIGTESEGILIHNMRASEKFSINNMADISLQEYLKLETDRLKNDPIYQQRAREYSEKESPITLTETSFNKADFTKNKHIQKKKSFNNSAINRSSSINKSSINKQNKLLKSNTKSSFNKTLNSTNRTLPSIRIDIRDLFKTDQTLDNVSMQKLNIKPNKK
jgi:hypothetical protein